MSPTSLDELHDGLAGNIARVKGDVFDGGDDVRREVPCSFDEFVTRPSSFARFYS